MMKMKSSDNRKIKNYKSSGNKNHNIILVKVKRQTILQGSLLIKNKVDGLSEDNLCYNKKLSHEVN